LGYGIEIVRFSSQEEQLNWRNFVLLSTYQRLKIGKREDASTYWKVLESSDYLGQIVTPNLRSIIKKRFFYEWEKNAENPLVNQPLLLFHGKKAVATLTMSSFYPNTNLGHHFSIDRGIRKGIFDVGRELTAGFLYMLKYLVSTHYFISYFYADKAWNDWMYKRFLNNYPVKEAFIYDRNYLYKCLLDSKETSLPNPLKGIDVKPENDVLLARLSRFLKKSIPKIEFEAFSYDKDIITLEAFSKKCMSNGYERGRRIFFALEGDIPLAALIAETGDIGINTFSLLNSCWIVYLQLKAKQDDRVLGALLKQAINFYSSEKKLEFLFIDYDGIPKECFEKHGIRYFADGMRWLASREILPAYINYVEETFGMLHNRFKPY
jgi:hypothetical protein